MTPPGTPDPAVTRNPPPVATATATRDATSRDGPDPFDHAAVTLVSRRWPRPHLRPDLYARLVELARFGSVGAVAFVVDMGVFNLLRFGPGGLLDDRPLTARVVAVVLSTVVSWLGNRHWTFADRRGARQGRELTLYAAVNVLGIGIAVATLAVSHYLLSLNGPLADNVANVVGVGLGTVARYIGYKVFVFTGSTARFTDAAR